MPTEHEEQVALFRWAALHSTKYPDLAWLYSIPNGAYKSFNMARRFQAEGLRKGYPDIGLDVARGGFHGLRLELKRTKGGRMSPEQMAWHHRLADQNYFCSVALGWEAAARTLEGYLKCEQTVAA